jgi:hypothetical protein
MSQQRRTHRHLDTNTPLKHAPLTFRANCLHSIRSLQSPKTNNLIIGVDLV